MIQKSDIEGRRQARRQKFASMVGHGCRRTRNEGARGGAGAGAGEAADKRRERGSQQ
jgi:hypothetical protein